MNLVAERYYFDCGGAIIEMFSSCSLNSKACISGIWSSMMLSTEDRKALRASLRRMFETAWPIDRAVTMATDDDDLRRIAGELSAFGIAELGGPAMGGLQDALLVSEELGRASCPFPIAAIYLCNRLLDQIFDSATQDFLAAMRIGKARPSLASAEFDGDAAAGALRIEGGRILGSAAFVEGLNIATHILAFTGSPPGVGLVAIQQHGVRVTSTPSLSPAPLGLVEFDRAAMIWQQADPQCLADAAALTRLITLSRATGAARRAFEIALGHAKIRRQFGHAIGEFQAVQHKLADCLTQLDGADLILHRTADAYDRGDDSWRLLADAAAAFAGPALRQVAMEVHHILGAIGYSEEHEAPRHFRNVHVDTTRFGGTHRARAALADRLLVPGAKLPSHDGDPRVIAFRHSFRTWLDGAWTADERRNNSSVPSRHRRYQPAFSRKLGDGEWLGLAWPKSFGGQERDAHEQLALAEELEFAEAPADAHMVAEAIIGPAIIKFGTAEQKDRFLPRILRGDSEAYFALHYSEPEAGSDLAALSTTARLDGAEWVISGQKLWSTNGDLASFAIVAARTDPGAKPKQAGISTFLVPLSTPGIQIRPSIAMYGGSFCATYYDGVRVPASALLGPLNGGWQVLTCALAAERVGIASVAARLQRIFYRIADHVIASDGPDGHRLVIRDKIGALAADLEIARQFALRNIGIENDSRTPMVEAAMSKLYIGELHERLTEAALDILGSGGLLSEGCSAAPLGEIERELRESLMNVIGGGTAEMQRNIIALRGLDLPRMSLPVPKTDIKEAYSGRSFDHL